MSETDVDPARGSLLIRHGKGDRRREVGMDDWGFEHVGRWHEHDPSEIVNAVHSRRAPMMPASAALDR